MTFCPPSRFPPGAALLLGASLLAGAAAQPAGAAPAVIYPHLKVNQLGWRPDARKVAVIADPQVGHDAPDPFTPSATLEVRRWGDDAVAFSGPATLWRGGMTHGQSGDRLWHFDFSALIEPGSYYVFDPGAAVGSGRFEIDEGVYRVALRHALRGFLYQRCGTPKDAAHAGPAWADGACHLGPEQDVDCAFVEAPSPSTAWDLSGGWHDAGDYNKYVNFADGPVHDLLYAFEESPQAFTDDLDLPESGNGVPDLLDELRWELDWFLRMQRTDGSVRIKVSVTDWSGESPPSADVAPRRYGPALASSTISACGAFAHAAVVYGARPEPEMQAYAATLRAAALAAWDWLATHPVEIPSAWNNLGFVNAASEDGAYEQEANYTSAAVHLFALTGETRFRDFVDARHAGIHLLQWAWAYPFEAEFQDHLLLYARTPGATAAVAAAIESAFGGSVGGGDHLDQHLAVEDPYLAWMPDDWYVWGTNRTKAQEGNMFLALLRQGLASGREDEARDAAEAYVHGLLGINPPGLVYLSAMDAYGAERSVSTFYHAWFADGTDWDQAGVSLYGPPPGFVPGGPHPFWAPDPSYTGPPLEPPANQPIQKGYLDWNTSWPENSWEITENSITYQGAVVRLLAAFVPAPPATGPVVSDPIDTEACVGGTASFAVTATGTPPLSLSWRRDGTPLAGPDADTLVIDPVAPGDAGGYDVVVTDGAGASTTSAAALLVVRTAPGTPSASLRLRRDALDVVLSWAPGADAEGADVLRCDAAVGPCAPAPHDTTAAAEWSEPIPAERRVWYRVAATNACGATD